MDSDPVTMGEEIKSVMKDLFQKYLKNELLTGVNISNLEIKEANLEKASFSNSSLQKYSLKTKQIWLTRISGILRLIMFHSKMPNVRTLIFRDAN